MRIVVISAGTSMPSSTRVLADRLAAAVRRSADFGEEPAIDLVELRELAHPLVDALLTGFPTGPLRAAIDLVERADGLVVVTPTHSASYSALLKAFVDVLPRDALSGVPVLIGATGGSERHSLVLDHAVRPLLSYLRALVTPTAVYAATSDFGTGGRDGLPDRIDRAAAEFTSLVAARGRTAVHRDDPVPFAELLAG